MRIHVCSLHTFEYAKLWNFAYSGIAHEMSNKRPSGRPICHLRRSNPYNTIHGGPDSKIRHVGDLGNIISDHNGRADYVFTDHMIKLRGMKCNIIGRGLIIHADEDDLGLGGFPDSLTTGHAGKRIACAVIGYAKPIAK